MVTARVFDTYHSSKELDAFIKTKVPKDHIVVAACKDECVNNLSNTVKLWFTKMGSKDIMKVGYRKSFAFIGKMGSTEHANEKKEGVLNYPVTVT